MNIGHRVKNASDPEVSMTEAASAFEEKTARQSLYEMFTEHLVVLPHQRNVNIIIPRHETTMPNCSEEGPEVETEFNANAPCIGRQQP